MNNQIKITVTDSKIKELVEKPKVLKKIKMSDSYPNWFDKNKFKNILAIIDSSKFRIK